MADYGTHASLVEVALSDDHGHEEDELAFDHDLEPTEPVRHSTSKLPSDATGTGAAPSVPARNLVVSQLPRSVDTAILRAIFSEFGELITALVMMDVQSGRSRGFGFVWFKDPYDAQRAMEAMNGKIMDDGGKPLKVFASEHPDGLSEAAGIDVLNFPSSIARTSGRDLFAKFGTLVKYEVAGPEGRASGSGGSSAYNTTITVEYESILEARAAVNALHGVRSLQFDGVNVNLHLPLVTKYLIPGARRATNSANASRTSGVAQGTGSRRHTPGSSVTSNRYVPNGFGASGSQLRMGPVAGGHVFDAMGVPVLQTPSVFIAQPFSGSPSHSGTANPATQAPQLFMLQPQQNFGQQGQQPFYFAQASAPTVASGVQPQPSFVPPGYVMVPASQFMAYGGQHQMAPPSSNGQPAGHMFAYPAPSSGQPLVMPGYSPQPQPPQLAHQQPGGPQQHFFSMGAGAQPVPQPTSMWGRQ